MTRSDEVRAAQRYQPVVPGSRSYEDDLHELWAGGHRRDGGVGYDPTGFRQTFEHIGRRIALASMTDEELVAAGIRVMVSGARVSDGTAKEETP
jgi:hypothetical protein